MLFTFTSFYHIHRLSYHYIVLEYLNLFILITYELKFLPYHFNYLLIKYISVLHISNYHLSFTPWSMKYLHHKFSQFHSIFTVKYSFKQKDTCTDCLLSITHRINTINTCNNLNTDLIVYCVIIITTSLSFFLVPLLCHRQESLQINIGMCCLLQIVVQ
jgi:hypothetical protein